MNNKTMLGFILGVMVIWAIIMYFMWGKPSGISTPYTLPANSLSISFNDSQNPPYSADMLAMLKKNEIEVNFFVTADNALKYSQLVYEAYYNGNSISCLGTTSTESDLIRCKETIKKIIGHNPICYRPTQEITAEFEKLVEKNGMVIINNEIIVNGQDANSIVSSALSLIAPQSEVTFVSDTGNYTNQSSVLTALPILISKIMNMGLKVERRCYA